MPGVQLTSTDPQMQYLISLYYQGQLKPGMSPAGDNLLDQISNFPPGAIDTQNNPYPNAQPTNAAPNPNSADPYHPVTNPGGTGGTGGAGAGAGMTGSTTPGTGGAANPANPPPPFDPGVQTPNAGSGTGGAAPAAPPEPAEPEDTSGTGGAAPVAPPQTDPVTGEPVGAVDPLAPVNPPTTPSGQPYDPNAYAPGSTNVPTAPVTQPSLGNGNGGTGYGLTPAQAAYQAAQQYNANPSPAEIANGQQLQGLANAGVGGYGAGQQLGGGGAGGGIGGGMGGMPPLNPSAYNPGLLAPAPLNGNGQNFLGSVFSSFQNAQNAANAANAQMYGNIQSGYNQLGQNMANNSNAVQANYNNLANAFGQGGQNLMSQYGNLLNNQTQGYGNIQNNQAQALGNIGQGYTSMLGTALGNLNLLGATEGTDLNQQFQNEAANAQQSLVNRGLNNTTVTDAVQRGIGLDQARAMTNLAEGVNAQTNQTLSQFGNPALQFGQQAVAANTGLGVQGLQNTGNIALTGLGANQDLMNQNAGYLGQAANFANQANQQQTQLGQNQLNFMQSVNQQGPDYNTLANLAMAMGAAGTGYGQNGFNNMPANFPSQNPVGPLPGAQLSNTNYGQPQQQQMPYNMFQTAA